MEDKEIQITQRNETGDNIAGDKIVYNYGDNYLADRVVYISEKTINKEFWTNSSTIFYRWIFYFPITLVLTLLPFICLWILLFSFNMVNEFAEGKTGIKWIFIYLIGGTLCVLVWSIIEKLLMLITYYGVKFCPNEKIGVRTYAVIHNLLTLSFLIWLWFYFDITIVDRNPTFIKVIVTVLYFWFGHWVGKGIEAVKFGLTIQKKDELMDKVEAQMGSINHNIIIFNKLENLVSKDAFKALQKCIEDKNFGLGIEIISKVIQQTPNFYPAYLIRGNLYAVSGDIERSIKDFELVVSNETDVFEKFKAYFSLAAAYEETKNQRARVVIKKATELMEDIPTDEKEKYKDEIYWLDMRIGLYSPSWYK